MKTHNKIKRQTKRIASIRKRITGTSDRPRVSVFKSNVHISAQIIDDSTGLTLASYSDNLIKKGSKTEKASMVGSELAKIAVASNITKVVFDRRGNKYHGRIKALADSLRSGGLQF